MCAIGPWISDVVRAFSWVKEGQSLKDLISEPTDFLIDAILAISSEQNSVTVDQMKKN